MEEVVSVRIWKNTNKLIEMGWEGIKTGQTQTAGGCLASLRNGVFIVLLNSANAESRFEDTVKIYDWYQARNVASLKNLREFNFPSTSK
jgi:D-alanyl-D-alanine carboxypeptidase